MQSLPRKAFYRSRGLFLFKVALYSFSSHTTSKRLVTQIRVHQLQAKSLPGAAMPALLSA